MRKKKVKHRHRYDKCINLFCGNPGLCASKKCQRVCCCGVWGPRKKMILTLRQLGERTGLSIGFLNDLEFKRRTCSEENFKKLEKGLKP